MLLPGIWGPPGQVSLLSQLWTPPLLIFFQGHNIHTFDLKLVWVDPGQDK